MKRLLLLLNILLLCCCSVFTNGQEEYRSTMFMSDTTQVNNLLSRAKTMKQLYPDSTIALSKEALIISKRIHDNIGAAKALLNIGTCYFEKGEYSKSKAAFNEAVPYCQLSIGENKTLLALAYNDIANVFTMHGYKDSAIYYYYLSLGEINKRHLKDASLLMLTYANIGSVLAVGEQGNQALYYLKASVPLAMKLKDTGILAQNYLSLGVVYENKQNGDSALYNYYAALHLYQHLSSNKKNLQNIYNHIGITYGREGNLHHAKIYFDSAIAIDPAEANKSIYLQKALGDLYCSFKKYRQAIPYYKRSIDICEHNGTFKNNLNAYYQLAECYYKTGNKDAAYKLQKRYSDLKDSLLNEEKIKTINEFEIKYRTSEKEKELTEKQLLITRQENYLREKNLWITGISISSLLLGTLLLTIYRNNRNKQKAQSAIIANLHQQQQLDQLQALMQGEEQERNRIARELHDGIGSMIAAARMHLDVFNEAQSSQADKSSYRSGMELLDDAYRELRFTAHSLLIDNLMENGLIRTVEIYCQRLSRPDHLQLHFQSIGTMPQIQKGKAVSLYRIIQELINNVAKHSGADEAIVEIAFGDEHLTLSVEDNGIGWKIAEDIAQSGIGVRNLQQRVGILGGTMEIDSRQGIGTTVYITFPVNKIIN